ncbi:RNA polymerase sigma factor [Novosphingobium terrae]|uniref:RNA polymerase sigma factor n=1 Tax=Novosphingobium terrae TaxID=2726189 RepID=UPI001F132D21|nr:sigma-70 family RNA polymerase sigma factor [Novosphingobium terrae]
MFNRRSPSLEASDLVQETFVRYAAATLERDTVPDSPENYLTKVAVNVMREKGRSLSHRVALSSVPVDELALAGPDELTKLEARDLIDRIDTIMMQLKPLTREIFIARRRQQLSRAEIAAQTGLSIKAVDKQIARAVEHIHRHLGEHHEA